MGEGHPTVAACVVLYQSSELLGLLLASLRRQTRPPDRYVFCVNGADDGVLARLADIPEQHEVLHRPDNAGFAGGMNACLAAAAGASHVLLLNPDVELDPEYIEVCLAVFAEEERVAGVSGKLLRPAQPGGSERIDTAGFVAQPWLRIVDRGAGAEQGDAFDERESVVGICAAAALFDRESLARVAEDGAVMDEDFWMYKEDQDLCIRLREAGQRLMFEPRATGHHGRGWAPESRRSVPLELRRHSLKNRYLILLKHWRWKEHGWTLPFIVGFEIFLFFALVFREPRTMKGYMLALRLVPRMLVKRRRMLERARRARPEYQALIPAIPLMV